MHGMMLLNQVQRQTSTGHGWKHYVRSPADTRGIKPSLIDSCHSPVLLAGDIAQHHGLAEAVNGIAQRRRMPRKVVLLDAPAGNRVLFQLVQGHGCKAGQQALPLYIQLACIHVYNAPAKQPTSTLSAARQCSTAKAIEAPHKDRKDVLLCKSMAQMYQKHSQEVCAST